MGCVLIISYSAGRVKRLTANDIIGHFLKHKEVKDLEERIQRIDERLETRFWIAAAYSFDGVFPAIKKAQ